MRKINTIKTETYALGEIYRVDFVTNTDEQTYEAWLYNKHYGVKMLMFGVPIEAQSYNELMFLVDCNLDDYIILYSDRYED